LGAELSIQKKKLRLAMTEEEKKKVVEGIFENAPGLYEDVVLYKGLTSEEKELFFRNISKNDKRLICKDYLSTSFDLETDTSDETCCLFELHIRKGTKMFDLSGYRKEGLYGKNKIIFPPGLNLEYKGRKYTYRLDQEYNSFILKTFVFECVDNCGEVRAKQVQIGSKIIPATKLKARINVMTKQAYEKAPIHENLKPDRLKFLIENGADVNLKSGEGKTPLMYSSNTESLKILVENGADVNVKDRKGKTPLMYSHNIDSLKILIENGADVNARQNDGTTVLMTLRSLAEVKYLISKGANTSAKTNKDETILLKNIVDVEEYDDFIQYMMQFNLDVNARDEDQNTPLMYAVKKVFRNSSADEKIEINKAISVLLENGAFPNLLNKKKESALSLASRRQFYIGMKTLLNKGANIDIKNRNGETLLWSEFKKPWEKFNTKKIYFLLDNGANADLTSKDGEYLIFYIIEIIDTYDWKIRELDLAKIIEKIKELDVKNENGDAALHILTKEKINHDYKTKLQIFKLLIENGANVNITNDEGKTPLLLSIGRREFQLEKVQILIKNGADVNHKDNSGISALARAFEEKILEIVKLLLKSGANINENDKSGVPLIFHYFDWTIRGYKPLSFQWLFDNVKGIDLNKKNKEGFAILHKLLSYNADKPGAGMTSVDLFKKYFNKANLDEIKLFVDNGADIKIRDMNERTPLMYAVKNLSIEFVKYLVSEGADINAIDSKGWTVLNYAIFGINKDIVKYILDKGAKEKIKDKYIYSTAIRKAKHIQYKINTYEVNWDRYDYEKNVIDQRKKEIKEIIALLEDYGPKE
jgi:ankyrin repeat protein